jgi:predicted nucleic acid-binding protein
MTPPPAYFIDSTVPLNSIGIDNPLREACRRIVDAASKGRLSLHASVEMVQEVVHHRLRRDPVDLAVATAQAVAETTTLLPFDTPVLHRSLDLIATGAVRGRDAVHAATALEAGFHAIVSTDRDFDGIPGLRRIDPADLDLP